jgi:phosphoserine phosphatase
VVESTDNLEVKVIDDLDKIDSDRIVTLDLGGTLVEKRNLGSTAPYIHKRLGMSKEDDEKAYNILDQQGLSEYINFVEDNLKDKLAFDDRNHVSLYGEAIQDLVQDTVVIRGEELGAQELVDGFRELGYEPFILSSSPAAYSRVFAEELGINVIRWRDYEFNDVNGDFEGIYVNSEGLDGKEGIVRELMKDAEDVRHFGNGYNDLEAAEISDGKRIWNYTENPDDAYSEVLSTVRV